MMSTTQHNPLQNTPVVGTKIPYGLMITTEASPTSSLKRPVETDQSPVQERYKANGHPFSRISETILPSYTNSKNRSTLLELSESTNNSPKAIGEFERSISQKHFLTPDYDDPEVQYNSPNTMKSNNQFYNPSSPLPRGKFPSMESLTTSVVGIHDVCGNEKLWKMLLAEFIGTLFLVLIGCGTCISGWSRTYEPSMVQIALGFGVTVATMAQAIGHISGCHINPAVTVGLLVSGKCSFLKAIFYIAAQCLGGICGSAILQAITPTELQGNLGMTMVNPKMDPVQGLFVEALITFVLVLTVCGVCDDLRKDIKGSAPLAIGLSISVCHLMAIQYTGSSMNPARTLGPAVIAKIWAHHWVYWAGPLLGGFVAGFIYSVAFQEKSKDDFKQEKR